MDLDKLNYIVEHIEEFAAYIKPNTVDKILDAMDLVDTIYSTKYMLRTTTGASLKDILIMIYKYQLLIGVCIIKDKQVIHKNTSLTGLAMADYLPQVKSTPDIECESIQAIIFKNNFFKDIGIAYDNKLTTIEKLNLLEEHIKSQEPVKEEKEVKELTDYAISKRKYYLKNKEKIRLRNQANKEKLALYQKEYNKKKKEKLNNEKGI